MATILEKYVLGVGGHACMSLRQKAVGGRGCPHHMSFLAGLQAEVTRGLVWLWCLRSVIYPIPDISLVAITASQLLHRTFSGWRAAGWLRRRLHLLVSTPQTSPSLAAVMQEPKGRHREMTGPENRCEQVFKRNQATGSRQALEISDRGSGKNPGNRSSRCKIAWSV